MVADEPAAAPPGTRVTVENLFAQVPARRKFLRSERAELGACVDVVRRLAMSRPDTGFTLVHEGRRQIAVQPRSEEHTSELQSLMRISYAVFCLKKTTADIRDRTT